MALRDPPLNGLLLPCIARGQNTNDYVTGQKIINHDDFSYKKYT